MIIKLFKSSNMISTKMYLNVHHKGVDITPWASCQIRKIAVAHAPGMPGTFSPSPQVSDPDMHHGTCVTHVPWCMPGSLYSSFLWNWRRGKTFPAFPAHAQPVFLRIWQEAHDFDSPCSYCSLLLSRRYMRQAARCWYKKTIQVAMILCNRSASQVPVKYPVGNLSLCQIKLN